MTSPEAKARILVIDDEHTIADTLKAIFSKAGMEAMAVYSAEQALALMAQWVPHMAIIDVQLPGMNGVDLAILLKARYPKCELTLFSGYASTGELLEKAKRDGHALEVIAKPVHPLDLLHVVHCRLADAGSAEPRGTA
jgi:DNA-binding NtrC family response regulator